MIKTFTIFILSCAFVNAQTTGVVLDSYSGNNFTETRLPTINGTSWGFNETGVAKPLSFNGASVIGDVITITSTSIGLGNVPNVDATNASNISSGTISTDRLPEDTTFLGNETTGTGDIVRHDMPVLFSPDIGSALGTSLNLTSTISALNFSGSSSGTNTGDQTNVSGNAGTATALQTARTINGVSFNGTSNITVTASAVTLTGNTLASGVTASSLTSVGTITSGTWNGTAITNTYLANSSITIAGTSTSLGGSITSSTILDSIGSTRGSILYRGSSGWTALTPGTSGNILTSNGSGSDPSWQPGGGGSGKLIGFKSLFNSSATVTIVGGTPPQDGTVPQRSELTSIPLTATYTPTSGTSELWIEVHFLMGAANAAGAPLIGVFIDGTDDAQAIFIAGSIGNAAYPISLNGRCKIPNPGAGVTRTIELRAGKMLNNAGSSAFINRSTTTDVFSTAANSSAVILEINP